MSARDAPGTDGNVQASFFHIQTRPNWQEMKQRGCSNNLTIAWNQRLFAAAVKRHQLCRSFHCFHCLLNKLMIWWSNFIMGQAEKVEWQSTNMICLCSDMCNVGLKYDRLVVVTLSLLVHPSYSNFCGHKTRSLSVLSFVSSCASLWYLRPLSCNIPNSLFVIFFGLTVCCFWPDYLFVLKVVFVIKVTNANFFRVSWIQPDICVSIASSLSSSVQ